MKRCLLAAAILVVVNIGLASADYVVVKVDLNQLAYFLEAKAAPAAGTPGTGNQPPYMPPPVAKGGKKGGFQPPPVKAKQPAFPGQVQPAAPPPDILPQYIYAYIETTLDPSPNKSFVKWQGQGNKQMPLDIWQIDCKLGSQKTQLLVQGLPSELNYWLVKSPANWFTKKFQDELKDANDDGKKVKLLVLAEWALQRGLLTEFNKCIDELKKIDAQNAVVAAVEKTRAT